MRPRTQVHHNLHEGKLGVLCLAPDGGPRGDDPEMRERLLADVTLFRRHRPETPTLRPRA